jgi:hypothetical protein
MRVTAYQLFEGRPAVGLITEIILIDFANGQERFNAVLATGIFTTQVFVFPDSRIQGHVIFEVTTHFGRQLRDGECTPLRFTGGGGFQNNAPVRGDDDFVFSAGAGLFRPAIQSLALSFGFVELVFSPGLRAVDSRLDEGSRKEDTCQCKS